MVRPKSSSKPEESPTAIRQQVSRAYTDALKTSSCCGGTSTPPEKILTSSIYAKNDLSNIPKDAITNSFGCGNPLAFADIKTGQYVIDLGSGAGIDILLAGAKVGPDGHVIGIDMTDAMLERARANIAESGMKHIEVRKGFIEELPVESRCADWIISNCVINLSPNKQAVFKEAFRVLKPGGRIQFSDIMVEDLPQELRQISSLYSSCVSGAIPESQYTETIRNEGFQNVRILERFVYEESQLRSFIENEELLSALKGVSESKLDSLIKIVVGKIWSAKIYAEKPES